MGGFSSNYEGGYLDFDDDPKWMSENNAKKNKYARLRQRKSYYETGSSNYRYINVLLTSSNLLTDSEQNKRNELCEIDDEDVKLELTHNQENKEDAKVLDVYYESTFIGSVQKVFTDEQIDNSQIINDFCFDNEQLKVVEVFWDGESFFLKQKV
ncbi:MAG: Unknown protein [uncultured Sulfurovum sp.]|uniref:Uncharacterized protein n=1 Tax=uncultured Sulfurovum sp. TaxID=269237 RepID=A0A6S6SKA2_9BACT|nr:MAG: Unknown protein [uncultured Sulfurovum sp.]